MGTENRPHIPVPVEAILASLPKLTAAERSMISAALLASGAGKQAGTEHHQRAVAVFGVLADVCARAGVSVPHTVQATLRVPKARRALLCGSDVVWEYAREHLQPKTRREHRLAIRILLEVLVRRLPIREMEDRFVTILYGLSKVGACVDAAFPGYGATGMLPFLLRRRVDAARGKESSA